jgi:hypothetical protein
MAVCSKEYLENRCAPNTRVPAMEKACVAWEKCMNRDPTVVGRARVSAETFAEIINSFIEPISYKTMVFSFSISKNYINTTRYSVFWPSLDQFFFPILHSVCYDSEIIHCSTSSTSNLRHLRRLCKCRI